MRDDSKCTSGESRGYCEFVVDTGRSDSKVQVEFCRFCHKRVHYNRDSKGRVDNARYLRDHVRDFAQPRGVTERVYRRVYGNKKT